jgi:hypothetical protein
MISKVISKIFEFFRSHYIKNCRHYYVSMPLGVMKHSKYCEKCGYISIDSSKIVL